MSDVSHPKWQRAIIKRADGMPEMVGRHLWTEIGHIEAGANRGEITRQQQYVVLCELARLRHKRGVEVTPEALEGMASIIWGMLWVGAPLGLLRLVLPVIGKSR